MAWNQQGGPWGGGGGGGGGPWSGGGGNSGGGGGRGSGGAPPDVEEMLRRAQDRLRRMMPGGFGSGKGIALIVLAVIAVWAATGFYRVQPDQQGVELLFGEYVETTGPGLNYWFPAPIGEVATPTVTRTNQITIGYRGADPRGGNARDVPQESMMLTGDQNIIDADYIVQWRIADAGQYLFNIVDVEETVKLAAESAMREIIGQADLEWVMTQGRGEVTGKVQILLQQILDAYGAGVNVLDVQLQQADPPQEVIDAFNDVQRARQDKERLQNEALAYRNDIVPRAKGEAERLIQQATGYKEQVVRDAEGEASRFLSVYESFKSAEDVTTDRLYLETMQDVLRNSDKVLLGGGAGGQGVVPYLPLPEIQKRMGSGQPGGTLPPTAARAVEGSQ